MTATETSPRLDLITHIQDERTRTKRVLDAYPAASSELKPHPTSASARELVHTMCMDATVSTKAVDGTLDMSKMGDMPKTPDSWAEVLKAYDGAHDLLLKALGDTTDDDFAKCTQFMTGPKQLGDVPRLDIVRMMLHDQIHHRGQLSVYLRMTGNKVPSIYGPSKDEPWN